MTELNGAVRVVARGHTAHLEVGSPVERNAMVVLERGARVVLAYPKVGAIYELRGPGRFVARGDTVESRGGSGAVAKRDMVSALHALRIRPEGTTLQGSATMRGASTLELQADGPTGSQLIGGPIRVCWMPLGALWLYRVRLIDDDGIVLFEAQTPDSIVELPVTSQLQANAPYLWHVLATGPNGRSAEAAGQFRRIDVDSEQALLTAEAVVSESDATGRALIRIARHQLGFALGGAAGCLRDGADRPLNASNPASPE